MEGRSAATFADVVVVCLEDILGVRDRLSWAIFAGIIMPVNRLLIGHVYWKTPGNLITLIENLTADGLLPLGIRTSQKA